MNWEKEFAGLEGIFLLLSPLGTSKPCSKGNLLFPAASTNSKGVETGCGAVSMAEVKPFILWEEVGAGSGEQSQRNLPC